MLFEEKRPEISGSSSCYGWDSASSGRELLCLCVVTFSFDSLLFFLGENIS